MTMDLIPYFKSVIDLIPVDSYFQTRRDDEKATKKSRTRRARDGSQELGPRAKQKLVKKRKFEPQQMKTTSERITQEENESDNDNANVKKKRKMKKELTDQESPSFSVLQERLKEKIAELELKRNPKNRSDEEAEKIRQRRRKERAKFKLKKMQAKQTLGHASAEMQGLPGQKNAKIKTDSTTPSSNGTKPIVNSQGKVVFSKFDFGEDPALNKKSKKKRRMEVPTGKNLKTLLSHAEAKKAKLEDLKASDPDKAVEVTKKESWEKALAKASGTKVKDDAELIKKSIKKEKAIKKQHAKKWKEREENVKEKMQKRQNKRDKNIQARKDNNKERKVTKRMKKFAKSVPGF